MVDITIGQYYPEDSVIHKLDPRVKLFGTLVFVVMVFMINNVIGYGLITLFLGIVIKMSKVPFKKMMKGIRGIIFIMLLSVVFNIFLTPGDFYNNKTGNYKRCLYGDKTCAISSWNISYDTNNNT